MGSIFRFTNAHTHALIISSPSTTQSKSISDSISFASTTTNLVIHNKNKNIGESLSLSHLGPSAIITSRLVATNIKSFVNRKMGLSTDIKPIPFILSNLLFHESDTGSLYLSNGVTTTLTQGPIKPEVITGKIIDAELNTISIPVTSTSPFAPTFKKQGGIIPTATINSSFYGILEDPVGLNIYNPNKIISSPTEGIELEFRSLTNNSKMGYATTMPVATRGDSYELKLEIRNTNQSSCLVGFSTSANFDPTSVFTSTDSGVAIGFLPTDMVYTVYSNDSSGGTASKTLYGTQKDTLLKTIEIVMSPTNIVCKLNNEVITLTNKIPTLTDQLYLLVYGIY